MEHKELTDVLNDLVRINNDRAEGYQKATEDLKPTDIDLRTMFTNMASTSTQYAAELKGVIHELGGEAAHDTTQSGKIYRLWMEIKSTLTAHDRRSILSLCEFGEDAALKTYRAALESDVHMPEAVREMILEQQSHIKSSHDVVKRYRDMHESVEH